MEFIFHFIKENTDFVIFYSIVLNVILLGTLCIQGGKVSKLNKKYEKLSKNMEGKNLEEIIDHYYEKVDKIDMEANKIQGKIEWMEEKILRSIQKLGFVRYNAFEEMGGELSFSMALLDEENNGLILTSIYNRNNNVVYGKPVKRGKSVQTLSADELLALDRAKQNSLDEYNKMIS